MDSLETHEGEDSRHVNHKNDNNIFAAILEEDENTKKTIDRDSNSVGKADHNINGSSAAKGIEETGKS